MSYRIARVAAGFHQDPRDVATEWAWADVLIWEAALQEVERVDGFARAERAISAASLTAAAFHEPKQIAERRAELQRAGRLTPLPALERVLSGVEAIADRMALAERVARRQRRRGEGPAEPFLKVMA